MIDFAPGFGPVFLVKRALSFTIIFAAIKRSGFLKTTLTMKNILILGILFAVLFGCDQYSNQPQSLHAYFDMDSLLNAQITALTKQNVTLNKVVMKDDKKESKTFNLDSAGWAKEFEILKDFNINKPRYVGSYSILNQGDSIIYAPIEGLDLPVQQFMLKYQDGQLSSLNAWFTEFKYIYSTSRHVKMTFENGLLTNYEIKGNQNMIILEAVEYQILGSISK